MSAPIVEFLVTGDEVMRGLIADTNTQITASKLYPLGLALRRTTVVGDRGEDIRRGIRHRSQSTTTPIGRDPAPLAWVLGISRRLSVVMRVCNRRLR